MRTILCFAPLMMLLACGSKSDDPGHGSAGHVESGGAGASAGSDTGASAGSISASGGGSAATGGVSEAGGTSAGGGKPAGGAGHSGGGGSMPSGGSATTAGQGGQGTGGSALVACDLRKIMCEAAQPICPDNQVPSVNGSCFGPCVPIESCACSAAADCPLSDRYTCWQRTHCGPYVR